MTTLQDPPAETVHWRSTFVGKQIIAAGLGDLADKLMRNEPLDASDAARLEVASLPMLGTLVELHNESCNKNMASVESAETGEAAQTGQLNHEQVLADWSTNCRELFAVREKFASASPARWTLRLRSPLDGLTDSLSGTTDFEQQPTGAEVLRILSLARLILPHNVEVSALGSEVGEKVACVAATFGVAKITVAKNGTVVELNQIQLDNSLPRETRPHDCDSHERASHERDSHERNSSVTV